MKRIGPVCIAIVFVLLLCNVASATNWVLVMKVNGWGSDSDAHGFSVYIDADSVMRSGDTISFWMLQVYNFPDPLLQNKQKNLTKIEAKPLTNPLQYRNVELYSYDATGKEILARPDFYDKKFDGYESDVSIWVRSIPIATRYAKRGTIGKNNTPKPKLNP